MKPDAPTAFTAYRARRADELTLDLDSYPEGVPGDDRAAGESGAESPPAALTPKTGPTLPTLLHGLGGLVIVAAFVMYLFQGWRDGDDLTRALLLVVHTGVLTLAGLASGHLLREAKGARLFIALALAAVPVSFAFLGGVIYPHLTWDAPQTVNAAAALWRPAFDQGLAIGPALLLTGAATTFLALVIWIGFLVMARRSAGSLAGIYLSANAVLLIPTRDELAISALLFGLAVLLGWTSLRLRRRDPSLATREGLFARVLPVLPLAVVAGRSLSLYAPEPLFFASLSVVGYLGLRQIRLAMAGDARGAGAVEAAALLLAGLGAAFLLATLAELTALADAAKLPVVVAVFAALLADLSRCGGPRVAVYRGAAAGVAATAMLVNLALFGGVANGLACLVVGLLVLAHGFDARRRGVFAIGLVAALGGLGSMARTALAAFTVGGWIGLVLVGIATIIAGSVLERQGARVRTALGRWSRHFDAAG